MLGITIRLGASKDQIVSTATGHVFADRYEARNRVKRVHAYGKHRLKRLGHASKHIEAAIAGLPDTGMPIGMEYVAVPDNSYLKACHAVVMDAARRGYSRAA